MSRKHFTNITEGELLSISAAKHDGVPYIVLSFRLDSESFEVNNVGIKPEQAVRLLRDLSALATNSDTMKEAIANTENGYDDYKRIMLEETVPKLQE